MLDVNQLTYTAIITINLPGSDQPATATITLTPHDAIPTGSGEVKLLRDCTLADLSAFADALEAEVWATHQERMLTDLAADEASHVKITILNETGRPLSTNAEEWLAHAVIFPQEEDKPETEPILLTEQGEESGVDMPPPSPDEEAIPTPIDEEPVIDKIEEEANGQSGIGEEEEAELLIAQEEAEPGEEPIPIAEETIPQPEPEETPPPEKPISVQPELRIAGLRRPLGHNTPAAVDILINELAFRDAQAHALSSLDREVAGVLVGPMPEKQPDGRYVVHITDIIIAKHTKMHGASVTYTPESWRHIHDRLAERYPNEEALIVGWYHTHPGFGIFLSGMDLFIHQNFFTQIWHVALVLDPVGRKSGFFCWNRGKSVVDKYQFPWPDWLAGSW